MPGVSAKVSVMDAMTPAIENMYRGVSQLISGMYKLNEATNSIDVSPFLEAQKSMAEAIAVQRQMENEYRQMAEGAQQAQAAQNEYTVSVNTSDNAQKRQSKTVGQINTALKQIDSTAKSLITTQKQIENEYNRMRQSVAQIEAVQAQLNSATVEIPALQKQIISNQEQIVGEYKQVKECIEQAGTAQKQYNDTVVQGANNVTVLGDRLASSVKRYVTIAAGAYSGKQLIDASDTWTNNSARLGLITNSLQEQNVLQQKLYQSAKDTRGVYNDMVDVTAKLGLLAGDSFGSNAELVKFTELMQKSFKLSGASTTERQSAMYQLTQAMASGKLQGDEFRSIMENAPMLANSIAEYTGVSKGELKELSSDGAITADIIKNALFMAADDIESKFSTMPLTFGEAWNNIASDATMAFAPVYEQMNNALNGSIGQGVLDSLSEDIEFVSFQAQEMVNWFELTLQNHSEGFNNIRKNVKSVISDFTGYNGVLKSVANNLISAFSSQGAITSMNTIAINFGNIARGASSLLNTLSPVLPLVTSVYVGFSNYKMLSGIFTPIVKGAQDTANYIREVKSCYDNWKNSVNNVEGAIEAATTAQKTFNIVSAANGIMGIVSAVLALTAAWESSAKETEHYTAAFRKAKEEAEDIANGAEYYNLGSNEVASYAVKNNLAPEIAQQIVNSNAQYQASIDSQFRMIDEYVRELENVRAGYTSGALLAGHITREDLEEQEETVLKNISNANAYIISLREEQRKKEKEYKNSANSANALEMNTYNPNDYLKDFDGFDVDNVENVNHINDTVDIASEDLKYFRDLADQEVINQFTSKLLQPQINVTFGEVRETADVDEITRRITDGIIEDLNNSGDLVHI